MKLKNQLIIFEDNDRKIEVQIEEETIWSYAHKIAYCFNVDRIVVVKYVRNVYNSGELEENLTCAKIAQVAADGKKNESIQSRFNYSRRLPCKLQKSNPI